jgi:hypothetical protein
MKDIIVSAITLGIVSAVARLILPLSKKFVSWLINIFVATAEDKITGSKMGAEKKEYVCKKLRIFGVKTNEFISDMIDGTVEAMNNKSVTVSDNLKETIKESITEQVEVSVENASTTLKNKLSKE